MKLQEQIQKQAIATAAHFHIQHKTNKSFLLSEEALNTFAQEQAEHFYQSGEIKRFFRIHKASELGNKEEVEHFYKTAFIAAYNDYITGPMGTTSHREDIAEAIGKPELSKPQSDQMQSP